jgi:hypothetical protein
MEVQKRQRPDHLPPKQEKAFTVGDIITADLENERVPAVIRKIIDKNTVAAEISAATMPALNGRFRIGDIVAFRKHEDPPFFDTRWKVEPSILCVPKAVKEVIV